MNVRNAIDPSIDPVQQLTPSHAASSPVASKASANSTGGSLTGDKAQLSSTGSEVAKSSAASADSDVRLDKVAAIQSAIQAGTYHVPAAEVAQKVIASLLEPKP